MHTDASVLANPPKFTRASISRGRSGAVDRDGGDFGGGLISAYSVITLGEALGHGVFVDHVMLRQVADAINANASGVKSRFTHPGLSGDGLGKFIGRSKSAKLDGGRVTADLHLAKSAHDAPDGDLAAYVMDLAAEDGESFGASIVFEHDRDAEEKFLADNSDVGGKFKSPAPLNSQNLPHARIKLLRASDIVDSPAANPGGMFHSGEQVFEQASAVCSYALGLSELEPESSEYLGVHPERLRGFVSRFLEQHGLRVVPADAPQAADPFAALPAAEQGRRYLDAFGVQGGVWFAEGKTFNEAQQLHVAAIVEAAKVKDERIAELELTLRQCGGGEAAPLSHGADRAKPTEKDAKRINGLSMNIARVAAGIKLPGHFAE